MKVIGVTGGVGAGKSLILNFIKDNYNAQIILADELSKELCKKGMPCFKPLIELLGNEVVGSDGEIDRGVMASKIFQNEELLSKVNGIIHPAVRISILSKIDELKRSGKIDFLIIEAALLIECGYREIVDELWYIYTDESVRKKRLKESRGYSDEKIESIIKSQLSEEEFRRNSDFEIDNSGDREKSFEKIRERLGELHERK